MVCMARCYRLLSIGPLLQRGQGANNWGMHIHASIPLLEDILAPWQNAIGADFTGYKNHVYRMLHFCQALHSCTPQDHDKLTIAACHHDIGIWSDHTVDYLPPSVAQLRIYLDKTGRLDWADELCEMVDMHHKLRRVRHSRYPLVEVFRQGDLVDFSMGLVRFGLPRATIRSVKAQFPNAGFHQRLLQLAGGWFAKHPISPPPFIKW